MDMKNNDIDDLIERLQGFDTDKLTEGMTDGLEQWCRHRVQHGQMVHRVVAMLVLLAMLSATAMTLSPELRHGIFRPKAEPAVEVPSPTPPTAARKASLTPDTLVAAQDSAMPVCVPQETPKTPFAEPPEASLAALPTPRYDFATRLPSGDSLYCNVVRVAHSVSVSLQGSATLPAGALVLPATVEHDGLVYEVTMLADSALAGCRELKTVTLPPTLSFIGSDAFVGCSALDTLYTMSQKPPRINGEWCFWEVPQEAVLMVPCRSGMAYRNAHCWDYFDSIVDTCEAPLHHDVTPVTIRINGNYLYVEGVFGETVRVLDIEGRLLTSVLCNGQCRISLGGSLGSQYTSAFLVQVGDRPAVRVTAPVRNNPISTYRGLYIQ